MNIEKVKGFILGHEGIKLKPYRCPAGKWTIGIGRNLEDKGISTHEAFMLLEHDVIECKTDLDIKLFPGKFAYFPEKVQLVLLDMRFQLGHRGFREFKKMIKAFKNNDYYEATVQMKDSKWYSQVPNRAKELIQMVEESM